MVLLEPGDVLELLAGWDTSGGSAGGGGATGDGPVNGLQGYNKQYVISTWKHGILTILLTIGMKHKLLYMCLRYWHKCSITEYNIYIYKI